MEQISKLSTFPRVISCLVMLFTAYLMLIAFNWVTDIPYKDITMPHSALVAAVYAPTVALFRFAFDFAGDGKIDSK